MSLYDEDHSAKSLLAQLLHDSRLYQTSEEYYALMKFILKLRNIAPFNAMLLNVQKPGLQYAASKYDWKLRFNRTVKDGSRPLIILWPFSPVALVFDLEDTEGDPLPESVTDPFRASGSITNDDIDYYGYLLRKNGIELRLIDYGKGYAGNVQNTEKDGTEAKFKSDDKKIASHYIIRVNKGYDSNVKFATLAHELAHLFLGHLGPDKHLGIPARPYPSLSIRELEAESVSFLVCSRSGVHSNSESYLADYVKEHPTVENLDLYAILKAAGKVETILELGEVTRFGPK